MTTNRTFTHAPAARSRLPLWIGLYGPSGSGKTFSALRLGRGIQRVDTRPLFVVDTESKRALHYADSFEFEHVDFVAPFGPGDYLAAIRHCIDSGAGTIIIDSCTHEHTGVGGVLEMQEAEQNRLAKAWAKGDEKREWKLREAAKFSAWQKPKADRQRLIDGMLHSDVNFILNFRAKEKLKIAKGKDPEPMGWMPVGGEEWIYECTAAGLLLPGADGKPTWDADEKGAKMITKCPSQFRRLLMPPRQLSEEIGEEMARWAAGNAAPNPLDEVLTQLAGAATLAEVDQIAAENRSKRWSRDDGKAIARAIESRKLALQEVPE